MANLPVAIERGHPSGSFDPKLPLTSGGLVNVPGVDSKTRNLSMTLMDDGCYARVIGGFTFGGGERVESMWQIKMHSSLKNRNC